MFHEKSAQVIRMANNIKQIRKSLGISVTELAQRLNMSQGNLTKIENGQVDLRLDTAQAIAKVLQCPLERIMKQEQEEISPLVMNLNLSQGSQTLKTVNDNMNPTLKKGDIAVIVPQSFKKEDGVYLINKDGREMVRRLQSLSGGKIALLCDNKMYQEEYVEEKEIEVIGKVIQKISISDI